VNAEQRLEADAFSLQHLRQRRDVDVFDGRDPGWRRPDARLGCDDDHQFSRRGQTR